MKTKVLMLVVVMFTAIITVNAQFQRRTVEERVKMVHSKIDSAFKFDTQKMANIDSIFANFYRSQDQVREEMRNGGGQDRQAMREKMQPLTEDRNQKLKAAMGDNDFKIWKEQIEPSMRPKRPNDGSNNQ
ncbi:MAG: hypothetical protein JST17_06295 [Bacteroidetes bacterium]|nr:hypothetical protein [Bacteroidota bacterium]MBS1929831.1 hypothetical protein [Bacteroidota bacterium]